MFGERVAKVLHAAHIPVADVAPLVRRRGRILNPFYWAGGDRGYVGEREYIDGEREEEGREAGGERRGEKRESEWNFVEGGGQYCFKK